MRSHFWFVRMCTEKTFDCMMLILNFMWCKTVCLCLSVLKHGISSLREIPAFKILSLEKVSFLQKICIVTLFFVFLYRNSLFCPSSEIEVGLSSVNGRRSQNPLVLGGSGKVQRSSEHLTWWLSKMLEVEPSIRGRQIQSATSGLLRWEGTRGGSGTPGEGVPASSRSAAS